MKSFRNILGRLRDDSGVALVFIIAIFLFLFVLILSVYSTGENIRRKEELQNACDAAAYSAAVVQADALSRMAVINRAMAWTYIQTTRRQMDYITYKWLRHVRDCFKKDMGNIAPTGLNEIHTPDMGYYHFSYPNVYINLFLEEYIYHFNCRHGVHNNSRDSRAHYIGLGPDVEGVDVGNSQYPGKHWILLNRLDPKVRRLQYNGRSNDLDYYENGGLVESGLVGKMKDSFGGDVDVILKDGNGREYKKTIWASKLRNEIEEGKLFILSCNAMLKNVNDAMPAAIANAARTALYQNLPRKANGDIDQTLLRDYVFAIAHGADKRDPYRDPHSRYDGYYSPLFNREEDELRFLAMANGLPENNGQWSVTLKDFFDKRRNGVIQAAGIDQWFIRCNNDEEPFSDALSVPRSATPVAKGLFRAYKHANYANGRAEISWHRTDLEVHRGNYTLGGRGARSPTGLGTGSAISPINEVSTRWWAGYSGFQDFAPSPDPSCINTRPRFVDRCKHVSDTFGLVAEYEWASAYWFCYWVEYRSRYWYSVALPAGGFQQVLSPWSSWRVISCNHIPLPSAIYGGKARDTYGGATTPAGIIAAQRRPYTVGSRRGEYHRTFIGGDAGPVFNCGTKAGANMGAKGYARIYGDDDAIANEVAVSVDGSGDTIKTLDPCYVSARAKPWMLNERFFHCWDRKEDPKNEPNGTILVGIARLQRNVFDWIRNENGGDAGDVGIFKAFTPDKRVGPLRFPRPRLVALAAARAAWAPRGQNGWAGGSGASVNAEEVGGGDVRGRQYEIRHDDATSVNGEGNLDYDRKLALDLLFRPRTPPPTPAEVAYMNLLGDERIGCVCGRASVDQRLRRQWNLSQTDWDAVLLPLRFAFAGHSDYDSSQDRGLSRWLWSGIGLDPQPQRKLAQKLKGLDWLRFTPSGGATQSPDTWQTIVEEPSDMDGDDTERLLKKRLIH